MAFLVALLKASMLLIFLKLSSKISQILGPKKRFLSHDTVHTNDVLNSRRSPRLWDVHYLAQMIPVKRHEITKFLCLNILMARTENFYAE